MIGTCILVVALGVMVLLCAHVFKGALAPAARDIAFPAPRLYPDGIAKPVEMRVPAKPTPPPGQAGDPSVVTNYVVSQNAGFARRD